MRISDWSSDVCSSYLPPGGRCRHYADPAAVAGRGGARGAVRRQTRYAGRSEGDLEKVGERPVHEHGGDDGCTRAARRREPGGEGQLDDAEPARAEGHGRRQRSEEHTSELQSLMRTSYAVFCLKKKKQ